jgi:hypothetical protein
VTADGEPVWFAIAKGKIEISDGFKAAGGAGPSGLRNINPVNRT